MASAALIQRYGRVLVPLVTPFDDEGNILYDELQALVDYIIRRGYADSLIVTGSTGEFYTMTDQERLQVWEAVKEAGGGRMPLIVGTGAAYTRQAVRLTQEAERRGFELAMVVTPYYSRPTQEEIYLHYKTIAENTGLPIMLYNIPLFTGVNLEAPTLERLLEFSNIVAIKEEAGINPTQSTDFVLAAEAAGRSDFTVYCGDDTMVLQVLSQGGVGVVSGGSQVVGRMMKRLIELYYSGDNAQAERLYLKMFPFFKALVQNGRVSPFPILRAAIEMSSGIKIGPPRLPLKPATEEEREVVRRVLQDLSEWVAG